MTTPENELAEARRELETLRGDLKLTVKILKKHRDDALAREAESKAKSKTYGDYDSQDARYYRGHASAYGLSLDALFQATSGEFGEEFPPPAATS